MKKLLSAFLIALPIWHSQPTAAEALFCSRERGVLSLQEDPELQELLHGWGHLVAYTRMYDACGVRNGRVIRSILVERLSRCPSTERQTIIERCVLFLMLDRVDSYQGSCADVARNGGRTEESVRAEAEVISPEEFLHRLDNDPKSLVRACF